MPNDTDHSRSTREDARGFADAFAAADDAFTFEPTAGESRTITLAELAELSEALGLDRSTPPGSATPGTDPSARVSASAADTRDDRGSEPAAAQDDALLTLDELGEALARAAGAVDDLDFDFGTRAHERARRRTAARLDAAPPVRRRISGSSPTRREEPHAGPHAPHAGPRASRAGRLPERGADAAPREEHSAADAAPRGKRSAADERSAADRVAMADAAAAAAQLLAAPPRPTGRFVRSSAGGATGASRERRAELDPLRRTGAVRVDTAQALPAGLRPSDDFLADPGARRTVEITGRPDGAGRPGMARTAARLREVQRDRPPRTVAVDRLRANPDRIAMWAVLLGILLVLIAVTSGSAGAIALPLLAL